MEFMRVPLVEFMYFVIHGVPENSFRGVNLVKRMMSVPTFTTKQYRTRQRKSTYFETMKFHCSLKQTF